MALKGTFNPLNPRSSEDVSEEDLQSFQSALNAGTGILNALYDALRKRDKGIWDKIAYALTHNNSLTANDIAQTPGVWGKAAKDVKSGAGDYIVKYIHDLIAGAKHFVDITSLYQFPDGKFKSAIQDALIKLSKSGRAVTVRILVGSYPDPDTRRTVTQREYLKSLIAPLKSLPGNLNIYVASQRLGDELSWNHSKIVAVDGQHAFLGGENQWDGDYLKLEPVHDLNIKLQGPAAFYMHQFIDMIWKQVCAYILPDWKSVHWKSGNKYISYGCLSKNSATHGVEAGNVTVLGAGRYAGIVPDGNPADYAMLLLLNSAKSVIRIAQQDLSFIGDSYWEPCMKAIAKAIVNKLDVYIVISNDYGKAGSGNSYSTGTVRKTAEAIRNYVFLNPMAPKGKALIDLLCSKLHISTLRFGPSDKWPNGYEFANHAKFFMVDDDAFYVGSENLYPSNLIEYGVFISSPDVIHAMRTNYWDQLWKYSSRVAISGSDAANCIFKNKK